MINFAKFSKNTIVPESLFDKVWMFHFASWQRINFLTDRFQGFWFKEHLRMATFHSFTKHLKSTSDKIFYCICWLKSCNLDMKKAVCRRCSIKKVIWITFQNSQVITRSSHPEVFCQKFVLKNFTKFTEMHLCRGLFLIKLQAGNRKLFLKRDSKTDFFFWILWIF